MASLPNWHPFLVHFPIALYSTAFVCDVSLLVRFRCGWLDRACVLLYVGAALASGAAALSGKLAANAVADSLDPDVNDAVALHGDWAFFSVVLLFLVAAMRFDATWRDRREAHATFNRMRLATILVSMIALGAVVNTAGRGGELVFRYRVAVQDRGIIPRRR
ncbi:MAG: hypothetical protein BMS9Abin37_3112 [Acidobacteriota bacterium]|nr:MAG: hypothetical protein BMS9Abin37_3112 [Acidobacteriota bacterium]